MGTHMQGSPFKLNIFFLFRPVLLLRSHDSHMKIAGIGNCRPNTNQVNQLCDKFTLEVDISESDITLTQLTLTLWTRRSANYIVSKTVIPS